MLRPNTSENPPVVGYSVFMFIPKREFMTYPTGPRNSQTVKSLTIMGILSQFCMHCYIVRPIDDPTDYFCNLHLDLPVCKENGLEIYDLEEKNPDHPRVKAYWDHWDQLSNWQESHAVLPGNVCDSFRLVNAV